MRDGRFSSSFSAVHLWMQGSQLSWNFTVVLKSAIVLKHYSFGHNVLIWTFVMLSLHFFTSHDYVYVAAIECHIMFSLVTLYCFMCNIALVTFLGLQYWSASMINIYEHRKTCTFCVLSLVKPTKVSWNFLKIWSWNFTSCCWEPCECKHRTAKIVPDYPKLR